MLFHCLAGFLRFLVHVLGVLCLALLLVGFWLGAEQVAVWTITTSPSTELNVNVWGQAPDLYVVVWWQNLARETNTRLGAYARLSTRRARHTAPVQALASGEYTGVEEPCHRLVALLISLRACVRSLIKEAAMPVEEHKAFIHRWVELWHTRNLNAVPDFVTSDFVRHDPHTPEVRGPAAEQQLTAMFLTAFPDLHFPLEDLVAEGDRVVARYTARGTQHGELLGIPPAGRQIAIAVVEIYRLAQGKIAEQWVIMDMLGMLQQLGALPAPGQAST